VSDDDLYDGYDELPQVDSEPVFEDATDSQASADDDLAPAAVFGSLEEFVAVYLLPLYRRGVSGQGTTWCAEWWRHPEAWVRLDALWRSWEYLRLDPATGMSVWLRDHADPHMAVLLSADGPFRGCKPQEHARRPLAPLPTTPIPTDVRDPTRLEMDGG
jgi:hypothetical protein